MIPRLALLFLVFLRVSAEDEAPKPAAGGLGFLSSYADGIVAGVAPRPFPEKVIDDLLIDGNAKKEETYQPYAETIVRLPMVILVVTFVFITGYIIFLCIACFCCTSWHGPVDRKLFKNLFDGIFAALALSFLFFAIFVLYAGTVANNRLDLVTHRLDHYTERVDGYIVENCGILRNIAKEDAPQMIENVKSKLLKNVNELAANLAAKIKSLMDPLMGKVDNCVAALATVSSEEVTDLYKYLDGLEHSPGIGGVAGPIARSIKINLGRLDVDFPKLEQFRGLNIRKDADSKLAELTNDIKKKSEKVLNTFDDKLKEELDPRLVDESFCGPENEITAKIKESVAKIQEKDVLALFDHLYNVMMACAVIVLIIAVLALFAVAVGCVQTNSKTKLFPPKWLYQGALGLALFFMIPLATLGSIYFLVFGIATDVVCDPWRHPESRPEMVGAVDKFLKKFINQNREYGLSEIVGNVENPFAATVQQCSDEITMVKILKLTDRFTVDEHQISDNLFRIERDIKESLVPAESTKFGTEYFKDLEMLREIDQGKVDDQDLVALKDALGPDYNKDAEKAEETLRKLGKLIETLKANVPAESEVDDFRGLSDADRVRLVARPFIKTLLEAARNAVDELLSSVKSTVEGRVANCGRFARITNDLRTEVCADIVDVYNVVWLGFFHIVLTFVPFVVFAGLLARMHDGKRSKTERKTKTSEVETLSASPRPE
ncbi:unnamed protein product [Bursaphelenchus xylophilus]|uniref:(pine wood nematode) hypothetical protein n=1 Tax=Bursaphelenchus xylophilus TaxID=6326 RepID=A0A1I7RXP2_BURXY|nr:unnamed protein product [Bursaphelenchus xylophilus]CAG9126627.1 unnamed protein product [Bursaphelenchus xylophilus]